MAGVGMKDVASDAEPMSPREFHKGKKLYGPIKFDPSFTVGSVRNTHIPATNPHPENNSEFDIPKSHIRRKDLSL